MASETYLLHSAHETSPRARLRRSSDSDMVLMDATRVLVADVEADVAMGNEGGTYKCSHGEEVIFVSLPNPTRTRIGTVGEFDIRCSRTWQSRGRRSRETLC